MTNATRFLLVLLRLAIGWHCLFEGVEKFQSDSWTSEPYLREASGPLAPYFWRLAGDRLAEEMTPRSLPDADPRQTPPHEYMPARLDQRWRQVLARFEERYGLSDEQRRRAEGVLLQHEDQTALWLLGRPPEGIATVVRTSPYGPPVQVTQTTPARLAEYEGKLHEARQYQTHEFSVGVRTPFALQENSRLEAAKAEANKLRVGLDADLRKREERLVNDLHNLLEPEQQKNAPAIPSRPRLLDWSGWRTWDRMDWIDRLVAWGLTLTGGALLVGLLTRTACVAGALMLLGFYLSMPPFPGVPANPRAEGHYVYVNKNLIEMLALLALATTRSGRWAGLDALLQFLRPRRWLS